MQIMDVIYSENLISRVLSSFKDCPADLPACENHCRCVNVCCKSCFVANHLDGGGVTFSASLHFSPCPVGVCGSVNLYVSNFSFYMDKGEDSVTWGMSEGAP